MGRGLEVCKKKPGPCPLLKAWELAGHSGRCDPETCQLLRPGTACSQLHGFLHESLAATRGQLPGSPLLRSSQSGPQPLQSIPSSKSRQGATLPHLGPTGSQTPGGEASRK